MRYTNAHNVECASWNITVVVNLITCVFFIAGEDFSGVPVNLTLPGGMAIRPGNEFMQFLNVTIFDDNIVEELEVINLRLTTQTPDIVSVDQNVARIEIDDDDGMTLL